jgi:hypothetical protein
MPSFCGRNRQVGSENLVRPAGINPRHLLHDLRAFQSTTIPLVIGRGFAGKNAGQRRLALQPFAGLAAGLRMIKRGKQPMKKFIEVVRGAGRNCVAIGYLNIADFVLSKGVFEAARELNAPVIVGASEGERELAGTRELAARVSRHVILTVEADDDLMTQRPEENVKRALSQFHINYRDSRSRGLREQGDTDSTPVEIDIAVCPTKNELCCRLCFGHFIGPVRIPLPDSRVPE